MYAHYTAHARQGLAPLADHEVARWLWWHLRDAFDDAIAVILMPDHPHFIAPFFDGARRRLAAILGACARAFGLGEVWMPVPEPDVLETPDKVNRGVRYTFLNSCRPWRHDGQWVRLVSDPLSWGWSTLRDSIGAIADPWVSPERLAEALRRPVEGFAERLHRYVSSDGHVSPTGTAFPVAAPSSDIPARPLADIGRAALECARAVPEMLSKRFPVRRIFAALAFDQGWTQPALVAESCGVRPNAVRRLAASCPPEWLAAAKLCLGDERLVHTPDLSRFVRRSR